MMTSNAELIAGINEVREAGGNFQSVKKKYGADKLRELFLSMYPRLSLPEIQKVTGIPDSSLGFWFMRLGIPAVRRHVHQVSYPANFDGSLVVQDKIGATRVTAVNITPELAYVIGFVLGDGSVQKFMTEVFNQDPQIKRHLMPLLQSQGTMSLVERSDGLWKMRLSSGRIANLIKDIRGIREDTLDYIFANDNLAQQFVAAFWDAEGSVRQQNNSFHIYLYNTNFAVLERIAQFLKENGILFSIHDRKTRDKSGILRGRVVQSKKTLRRLSIPKSSRLRWAQLIGAHMRHSKKSIVVSKMLNTNGGIQHG